MITAIEPCSLAYLCTDTDTQRHTHRLPGLCHSAAVTATALRAPAHPQLLLRLTAIKVVCEFPKTRHLSPLRSPPPPSVLLPSFPLIRKTQIYKKCFWLCSQSSLVPNLLTCSLPSSASSWISVSRLSVSRRSESPCAPSSYCAQH